MYRCRTVPENPIKIFSRVTYECIINCKIPFTKYVSTRPTRIARRIDIPPVQLKLPYMADLSMILLIRLWSHFNPRVKPSAIFRNVYLCHAWPNARSKLTDLSQFAYIAYTNLVSILHEANIGPFDVLNVRRVIELYLKSDFILKVYFNQTLATPCMTTAYTVRNLMAI